MPITSENGRRRARLVAGVVAVLLAVCGVTAVALGFASQDPAPPSPPAAAPSTPEPTPDPTPSTSPRKPAKSDAAEPAKKKPVVDELTYSRPVNVAIPRIGVSSSLVDLGLDSNGVMETPDVADKAGWFTPSPPPGIPGATVISGHVTYNEPAVFFRLGDLRRGDLVEVEREDGVTTIFEVTRIGSFAKDGFPTGAVYSQPDHSELRLITCGGPYDDANNRYLENVIVWAKIVGAEKA